MLKQYLTKLIDWFYYNSTNNRRCLKMSPNVWNKIFGFEIQKVEHYIKFC